LTACLPNKIQRNFAYIYTHLCKRLPLQPRQTPSLHGPLPPPRPYVAHSLKCIFRTGYWDSPGPAWGCRCGPRPQGESQRQCTSALEVTGGPFLRPQKVPPCDPTGGAEAGARIRAPFFGSSRGCSGESIVPGNSGHNGNPSTSTGCQRDSCTLHVTCMKPGRGGVCLDCKG
jgi:hypothetical protein